MIREERRLAERLLRLTKIMSPWMRHSSNGVSVYKFSLGSYIFLLEWRSQGAGGTLLTIQHNTKPAEDIWIQGFLVEQLYQDVYAMERAWLQSSAQSGKQKTELDEKEKARREILQGALRLLGEIAK